MTARDSEPLSPDEIFEILSNHRRRMVLYYLRQQGDVIDVRELAEEVAAMENDVAVSELTSQQRKRVYVSLYQTHLPKMDEMNLIEYDKDEGTVRLTDQTTTIDRYLTDDQDRTYPWKLHYVVLTVLGGGLLALSLAGFAIFDALSPLWTSIGLLFLFTISAIVQNWLATNLSGEIPFELTRYDR
ncbi:MAG: DUF7344 domain-containing protein [Halodesulfurarchaeum sp.]